MMNLRPLHNPLGMMLWKVGFSVYVDTKATVFTECYADGNYWYVLYERHMDNFFMKGQVYRTRSADVIASFEAQFID